MGQTEDGNASTLPTTATVPANAQNDWRYLSTAVTTEYSELEYEESGDSNGQRPLLSEVDDDDESGIAVIEPKLYKLPSDGGSIFSSFVSISFYRNNH
jgi:hypothetical protein